MANDRDTGADTLAPATEQGHDQNPEAAPQGPLSIGGAVAAAQWSVYFVAAAYATGFVTVTASRGSDHLPPIGALDVRHLAAGILFLLTLAQCAAIAWAWREAIDLASQAGLWPWCRKLLRHMRDLLGATLRLGWGLLCHLRPVAADIRQRGPLYAKFQDLARSTVSVQRGFVRLLWRAAVTAALLLFPLAAFCWIWSAHLLVHDMPLCTRISVTAIFSALVSGVCLAYALTFSAAWRGAAIRAHGVQVMIQFLLLACMLAAAFGLTVYPRVRPEFGGGSRIRAVVLLDPKVKLPIAVRRALGGEREAEQSAVLGQVVDVSDESITILADHTATPVTVPREDVAFIIYGSDEELDTLAAAHPQTPPRSGRRGPPKDPL